MSKQKAEKLKVSIGKASYQGERTLQEDSFYAAPMSVGKPWLGVVSDGMGGHQSGDVASQIGVQSVKDEFERHIHKGASIKSALRSSVEHAHRAVVSKAESLKQFGDMGATIVAFAIDKSVVTWCAAGDSRLYLVRDGSLTQLSRDFTLATDLEQAVKGGHVTRQEVEANPQRSALTSFLGAEKLRTDEGAIRALGGDFFVACTDGIYGTTSESGLIAACSDVNQSVANPAEKAVDILFNEFLFPLKKPKQDNATVIIASIQEIDAHGNVIRSQKGVKTPKTSLMRIGIVVAAITAALAAAVGLLLPAEWRPFSKNETVAKPVTQAVNGPATESPEVKQAPRLEHASPAKPETSSDDKKWDNIDSAQAERALLRDAKVHIKRAQTAEPRLRAGLLDAAINTLDRLNSRTPEIQREAALRMAEARKLQTEPPKADATAIIISPGKAKGTDLPKKNAKHGTSLRDAMPGPSIVSDSRGTIGGPTNSAIDEQVRPAKILNGELVSPDQSSGAKQSPAKPPESIVVSPPLGVSAPAVITDVSKSEKGLEKGK